MKTTSIRRKLSKGLASLVVALAAVPAFASAPITPVTLDEAIARALHASPAMAQANGATRTAAAAERRAFGSWLPSLSMSAGSSLSRSAVIGTNPATASGSDAPTLTPAQSLSPSLSAGLSASWEVFSMARFAEGHQVDAQQAQAAAQLEQQKAQVTLTVVQAFSDEERAEALLGVTQSRVDRAQTGLDAANRKEKAGSATRSDVLRAQLELNTANEALRQGQATLQSARFALGRLIGAEGPADAKSAAPADPTPLAISEDELVATLISDSPAVKASQAGANSASAGVNAAMAAYFPTVHLSTGYDLSTRSIGDSYGQNGFSVGVGLSWNLFDGFRREESVERARVAVSVADAQLEDLRRSIRAAAESDLGQLKLQEDRIGFAAQALEVAKEDLRVQQQRYALGATTMLDLLASQSNLAAAETAVVTTRFDYQLARAELQALAGRLL
jgi:outer membrane protein TolC